MHGCEGYKTMLFRFKTDSIIRGQSLALVQRHSRLDIRKYYHRSVYNFLIDYQVIVNMFKE